MGRSTRCPPDKIRQILQEADREGIVVTARRYGVSPQTIRRWRKTYGETTNRVKQLEEENRRLREMLEDREKEIAVLRSTLEELEKRGVLGIYKNLALARKIREILFQRGYKQFTSKLAEVFQVARSSLYYVSQRDIEDQKLSNMIRKLAQENPTAGYRTIHRQLRDRGIQVSSKRVYRIYRKLGLSLRKDGRKGRRREGSSL